MKGLSLRLGFVVLPLVTIFSCTATTQKENAIATSSPTNAQKTKPADKQNAELQKQIEQITALAKGRVGVAAQVLETGESVSLNPNEHCPMQSVYKLPIGFASITCNRPFQY